MNLCDLVSKTALAVEKILSCCLIMIFGTLYSREHNPRSTAIMAIAKANNLQLELRTVNSSTEAVPQYLELNLVGQVPTFVRVDGIVLTECIAIAFCLADQDHSNGFLGISKGDVALIIRWMCFINMELYGQMGGWFLPMIGRKPYGKASVETHIEATQRILEKQLMKTTYLIGERLTLADLFGCGMIAPGFFIFFDTIWRARYPNVTRWIRDVYYHPIYQAVSPAELVMCEVAIPNEPVQHLHLYAR